MGGPLRDRLAAYIRDEGHRVDVTVSGDGDVLAEIVFRTRGQTFSLAVSELAPNRISISTAYEVPDWVRERAGTSDALADIEGEYPGTHFAPAHDGTIFIATLDVDGTDLDEFTKRLWGYVGRLREAGNSAVERMVDRSESKAAADKFIREFLRGER